MLIKSKRLDQNQTNLVKTYKPLSNDTSMK